MPDRLHGITLKLKRAAEHLKAVEEAAAQVTYTKCKVVCEKNLKSGLYELRLLLPEPDEMIRTMIGDCLHNLRCSLDYIVHELVLSAHKKPSGSNMFPIASTIAGWERHMKADRLCGVAPNAKTIIQGLQPYHFPNPTTHPLWRLNQLENIDKHRALTVAVVVADSLDITFDVQPVGVKFKDIFGGIAAVMANYRNNAVIASSSDPAVIGGEVEMQGYASSFVAFQDSIAKDVWVTDALGDMLNDITSRVLPALTKYLI